MDLKITKTLVIPSNEIKWRFSRSSGPGGQNVNKIESRVEIIFNLEDSKVLNDYQKEILKRNLKTKLVNNSLRLAVQAHRNQLLNRPLALMKFSSMIKNALEKNISRKNIIVDPGIGFSKDLNQNLEILRNLDVFKNLNLPILIGASRKRFIGEVLNENNPKERDIGTLAISCLCSQLNIDIVRVHNVKLNYQILKVADKIYRK